MTGEFESEVATEAANESNERHCCCEVIVELPTGALDLSDGFQVICLASFPLVYVLVAGPPGAPEAHPDHDAFTEPES